MEYSAPYRVAAHKLCSDLVLLLLRADVGDEDAAGDVALLSSDDVLEALDGAVQPAQEHTTTPM